MMYISLKWIIITINNNRIFLKIHTKLTQIVM